MELTEDQSILAGLACPQAPSSEQRPWKIPSSGWKGIVKIGTDESADFEHGHPENCPEFLQCFKFFHALDLVLH
ncbi:hypothetical protein A6X21_12220 [Planctopirus hydrillae]|uniref:Uncharacterized protein n=1 Tax=Planctopirus hydrillae TaxID=1841610 RepID=A0A1C3E5F5_9PLAN|nr:hypothetical protein A6X21_12220 [Planctopirus hydrillae]